MSTEDNISYENNFRLKEMLGEQDLTVRELSRRIDYRFETVRQLVNGTIRRIPVDLLHKVCRELNCTPNDIINFNS